MKQFIFQKSKLKDLISYLINSYPNVYAPVPKGRHFAFERITDASGAEFNYVRTILPPKKYLMPQHESLVNFRGGRPRGY